MAKTNPTELGRARDLADTLYWLVRKVERGDRAGAIQAARRCEHLLGPAGVLDPMEDEEEITLRSLVEGLAEGSRAGYTRETAREAYQISLRRLGRYEKRLYKPNGAQ